VLLSKVNQCSTEKAPIMQLCCDEEVPYLRHVADNVGKGCPAILLVPRSGRSEKSIFLKVGEKHYLSDYVVEWLEGSTRLVVRPIEKRDRGALDSGSHQVTIDPPEGIEC